MDTGRGGKKGEATEGNAQNKVHVQSQSGIGAPGAQPYCKAHGFKHWGFDEAPETNIKKSGWGPHRQLGWWRECFLGKVLTRKRNHKQIYSCCLIARYIRETELYASFI